MKNKSFEKWNKRVNDLKTPWAENEIIYFRKAVGQSGIKDVDLRYKLLYNVWERPLNNGKGVKITQEQTVKGINYLHNICFKKNGSVRKAKTNIFGYRSQTIIRNFKEFRFMGLYHDSDNQYDFFTPIYRVKAKNGDYFDYTTNMGIMKVI